MHEIQDEADPLDSILARIRRHLPEQGPIGVFVHHNTLHAFEHMPFEDAVVAAGRYYGAEPFMPLDFYRAAFARGRITRFDVERTLDAEALEKGQPLEEREELSFGRITRREIELALLEHVGPTPDAATLRYFSEEGVDAEHDELVRVALARLAEIELDLPRTPSPGETEYDELRELDREIDAILIPLLANYLDQGLAYWPMSDDRSGLYETLTARLAELPLWGGKARSALRRSIREDREEARSVREALRASLEALGYAETDFERALERAAFALPGWNGLVARLEREPELAPHRAPPCRLEDALALRLLLERALRLGRTEGVVPSVIASAEIERGGPSARGSSDDASSQVRAARAYGIARVCRVVRVSPAELGSSSTSRREFERFARIVGGWDDFERRRILHLAYEHHYRWHVLNSLAVHGTGRRSPERAAPNRQIVFCIDDREESFRRHVEELDPSVATFGTGGFFGVAISYRGIDDGYHASLCPVVQKPAHRVSERPRPGHDDSLGRYRTRKKLVSALLHGGYTGTRSLLRGFASTFGFGVLSLVPLSLRVLAPRHASRLRKSLGRAFLPPPETELALERAAEEEGSLALFPGFTKKEMTDRVERVLTDIGLVRDFARVVALLGHGSSSLNNPLGSAYDCGACGGRKGAPNARLFARMANDEEVRRALVERGIEIPWSTVFVGGYHDTSSDAVVWFDVNDVPTSHRKDLDDLNDLVERARRLDAHERCRRFESVEAHVDVERALAHVEARSEDLAEPRPELGHATNAVCVFGRREVTRGLFLDRRAFLVSYDPSNDADGEILGRLLQAMGPVGAGISLEYYFSRVDGERYGSGTKLPHNVVGLLGIMNGSRGDLRTGLPVQMVELHEPMRLLVVVEATPERVALALARHPAVRALVENRWIQVALVDPESGLVSEFRAGEFVPVPVPETSTLPEVESSLDWYRGRREHLEIARIRRGRAA